MKVFLHRISHHEEVSYPLLDRNILTIGWSDFKNEQGSETFEKDFEYIYGELPRNRWCLRRFLFDMEIGDWVVIPKCGTFSIFQIESAAFPLKEMKSEDLQSLTDWQKHQIVLGDSGYLERETEAGKESIDLGFFRKVSVIASDIPRSGYADSRLTSRMKIRQTNADITDLQENVKEALNKFHTTGPFNLSREILSQKILGNTCWEHTYNIILKNLNPSKWEKLIGLYFEKLGASVEFPPKNESGKEGDSDITATFEALKTIYHIQAKFHEGTTSSDWALAQIKGYCKQQENTSDGYTTIPWVISSAGNFSSELIEQAKENNIQLISGMEFVKMLLENGITRFDEI